MIRYIVQLKWSKPIPLRTEEIETLFGPPSNPLVRASLYDLVEINSAGTAYTSHYIGQTQNLRERMLQHLDLANEKNPRIRRAVEKIPNSLYFIYAVLNSEGDRIGSERYLIDLYKQYGRADWNEQRIREGMIPARPTPTTIEKLQKLE